MQRIDNMLPTNERNCKNSCPDFIKSQLTSRTTTRTLRMNSVARCRLWNSLNTNFVHPSVSLKQSRTKRLTKKQRRFVPDPSEENGIKSSEQRDPSPPWSSYLCSRLENLNFQTHRKKERGEEEDATLRYSPLRTHSVDPVKKVPRRGGSGPRPQDKGSLRKSRPATIGFPIGAGHLGSTASTGPCERNAYINSP